MKEFISSPDFLWWMSGIAVIVVVTAVLIRNTVWEARGITPTEDVEKLRLRMMGLIPKSKKTWSVLVVILFVIAIGFSWKFFEVTLEAPSPGTVWANTKKHWLWFLSLIGLAYLLLSLFPKDKDDVEKAGKVQKALVAIMLVLFVGMPLVHLAWGEKTTSPQAAEAKMSETKLPDANLPQSRWATVSIVGHGESFIPRPSGKHTLIAGRDLAAYAVYAGGHECSFKQKCPEGSVGTKVKNESAEERIASYAFAPD